MNKKTALKGVDSLESYTYHQEGYEPFLIRQGWQIAKLNYFPKQALDAIRQIDIHFETDEAFILLKGTAILIVASVENDQVHFKCEKMKEGVTYNIPQLVWHNIALKEDAEVFIVEKDNTHLSDFDHRTLKDEEIETLKQLILEAAESQ